MQGWPALSVEIPAAPLWRAARALLCLLAAAALLAWVIAGREQLPSWALLVFGAAGAGAVLLAASGLRREPPWRLAWDGRRWTLQSGPASPQAGTLAVALDAGPWMLLRFDADAGEAERARRHWIAAGRRGLGADWHALRCAVYSARPAPGGPSAADPPASDE